MDIKLCEQLGDFCRNPNYSGCNKKCPCPLVNNCSYYIDDTKKDKRLKNKESNYSDYYDTYFRSEEKLSEVISNG